MMNLRLGKPFGAIVAAWICVLASPAAFGQIELRFGNPGVQNTAVTGTIQQNFDSLTAGQSYATIDYPNGAASIGTFTPAPSTGSNWVRAADQFGGAGGTGNFLLSGNVAGISTPLNHTLSLNSNAGYFGVWVPSMDSFNQIRFLQNGTLIATFNASTLLGGSSPLQPGLYNAVTGTGHFGNPNPQFNQGNPLEPFVYLNFYAENAASQFNAIEFIQLGGNGGFEIDNLAISNVIIATGRDGTLVGPLPVPEPFGLTAAGAAALFGLSHLRRKFRTSFPNEPKA